MKTKKSSLAINNAVRTNNQNGYFNLETRRTEIVTCFMANEIEHKAEHFKIHIDTFRPQDVGNESQESIEHFQNYSLDFRCKDGGLSILSPPEQFNSIVYLSLIQAAANSVGFKAHVGTGRKVINQAKAAIIKFLNKQQRIHIEFMCDHHGINDLVDLNIKNIQRKLDPQGRITVSLLDSSSLFNKSNALMAPTEMMEANPFEALKYNPFWNPETLTIDASFCILDFTIEIIDGEPSVPMCIFPSENEPGDFSNTDSLTISPRNHSMCEPKNSMKNYAESILRQAFSSALIISTMNRHIPEGGCLGDDRENLNRLLRCSPPVNLHLWTDIAELIDYSSSKIELLQFGLDPKNRVSIHIHEYHQ